MALTLFTIKDIIDYATIKFPTEFRSLPDPKSINISKMGSSRTSLKYRVLLGNTAMSNPTADHDRVHVFMDLKYTKQAEFTAEISEEQYLTGARMSDMLLLQPFCYLYREEGGLPSYFERVKALTIYYITQKFSQGAYSDGFICPNGFWSNLQAACTSIHTATMRPDATKHLPLVVKLPAPSAVGMGSQEPPSNPVISSSFRESTTNTVPLKRRQPDATPAQGGAGRLAKLAKKPKNQPSSTLSDQEVDHKALTWFANKLHNGRHLNAALEQANKDNATLKLERDTLKVEADRFRKERDDLTNWAATLCEEILRSHNENTATTRELHNLRRTLQTEHQVSKDAAKVISDQVDAMTAELDSMKGRVDKLTAEKTNLASEKSRLEGQVGAVSSEKNVLTAEKDALLADKTKLEGQVDALEAAVKNAIDNLNAYKKRVRALGNEF